MSKRATTWAHHLVSSHSREVAQLHHQPLAVAQAPWLVEYELSPEKGEWLAAELPRRSWTLWRYRELLPVEASLPPVDLGEGGTPLVRLRRLLPVGIESWLKEEAGNPTGSFKARGLSLAINRAVELGAPGVQIPSAGNAALAASAYAAAAGLPCRIAVPEETPSVILDRCRSHGAEVITAGHTLVDSARLLAEEDRGFWDLSTFKEPYRVEGKKTMGFELAEQLGWQLPDWIVYPTGGGTGIVAMAKAFDELRRLGLLRAQRTRFVVVQMEGCAPIVEAWQRGADEVTTWENPSTNVWGLRVPKSIADFLILRALRDSDGVAVTVPESAVEPMRDQAARLEGVQLGPEGAAALAGLQQLINQGKIVDGQQVVVYQTGHPANYD